MAVTFFPDTFQAELVQFPNIDAARFRVHPLTSQSAPKLAIFFSFEQIGSFYALLENYSFALGLNKEELIRKYGHYKDPSKELSELFQSRIAQIDCRFRKVSKLFEEQMIFFWQNRLYRTLISQEEDFVKSSKKNGFQFGSLRKNGSTFINSGALLPHAPSMKVLKRGIDMEGIRVVIAKPTSKKYNSRCPNAIMQIWNNEMTVWELLQDWQKQGVDLTGVLVPREIFPEVHRAVFDMREGDLNDLIRNQGLNKGWIASINQQLAKILLLIHRDLKIVHGDLKLQNILYTIAGDGSIKIELIDWGLWKRSGVYEDHVVGTLGHVPPEYYDGTSDKRLIDHDASEAWSFGVLLWELNSASKLDFCEAQIMQNVKAFHEKFTKFSEQPELSENTPLGIARRLMGKDPKTRWSVEKGCEKILEHYSRSPKNKRTELIGSAIKKVCANQSKPDVNHYS